MLFRESILYSADNSGIKKLKCINMLNSIGCPSYARLGSLLVVVAVKIDISKKIKKKIIYYALVITCVRYIRRQDGTYLNFFMNKALLFNNADQEKFLGSRIYGPLSKEARYSLRDKKHKKVLSFVSGII